MSIVSWLFPKKNPAKAARTPESSGLSRMEATRPAGKAHPDQMQANATPANRKSERMARRELLYNVVRESMVRAGVLSASYKFKVLSLDARGRQFLVMMDLAREFGGETSRLAEIEAMIAQNAKARYDIVVTAVYWRMNEHVAVGQLQNKLPTRPSLSNSAPMPLESQPGALAAQSEALVSQPGVLVSQPAALPGAARVTARFEPIHEDEVAAFKRALAAGVVAPAAVAATAVAGASAKAFTDGSGKHGPQSYTLLTGFEDTEMPDSDVRAPALSGTQYGELN